MARIPTGNGSIVAAAVNLDTVQTIAETVGERRLDTYCGTPDLYSIDAVPYEEWGIRPSYLKALRQPFRSAQYTLQHGASRTGELSLIDWWTFTGQARRRAIEDELFDTFTGGDAVDGIAERADISTALRNCFPVIGDLGVGKLIEARVWEWVKQERRDQLSSYSRRALRNGANGREFEQRFEQFCEANRLEYWKRSKAAFRRHVPDAFDAVDDRVESFKGIPDYFVDKGNTHALTCWIDGVPERRWAPDSRYAFVECKYNDSALSPEQRRMVDELGRHGIEVAVFRGTPDDYRFTTLTS